MSKEKHVLICGAAPDTGNLGVSALANSLVSTINEVNPDISITLADNGKGVRDTSFATKNTAKKAVKLCGAKIGKKFYHQENYQNINLSSSILGGITQVSKHFNTIDYVFDISGGDSFTDLYGKTRFDLVNAPKKFAIKKGLPLVFLPQTYGPFNNENLREEASYYLRNATLAFARDLNSFEVMKSLLGDDFDSSKHRLGVDMAFSLPTKRSCLDHQPVIKQWIENKDDIFGLNVSGLIYNDPSLAKERYGFVADYMSVVEQIVDYVLNNTNMKLLLVSHVNPVSEEKDNDFNAAQNLIKKLKLEANDRVQLHDNGLDQCEIKWLIGHCAFFMGTRMHATIAALSQKVPVATVAYSDKAKGVFASCDVEKYVIDPRVLTTEKVVDEVLSAFLERDLISERLDGSVENVKRQSVEQIKYTNDYLSMLDA